MEEVCVCISKLKQEKMSLTFKTERETVQQQPSPAEVTVRPAGPQLRPPCWFCVLAA